MPPLTNIGIPVIDLSNTGGNKGKTSVWRARKPRTYGEEPLPTKLSDRAPKNARIVGRNIDDHGVAYHLKIGDVDINDIRIHEVLEYVSALQLEEFENSQFEEEREVLRVMEAEEEKFRQEKLERQKQRAKTKGVVLFEDVSSTNEEAEDSEVALGKHGRERPKYTNFFLQPEVVRRRRKRDPETGELMPLSDDEQNESSGIEPSTFKPLPSPKRGRLKKLSTVGDGVESALSDFQQPGLPLKKRPRRRRHPQTGELMPLGWRFDPQEKKVDDEKRVEVKSPSFKRLSISQDHVSKRQRLDTKASVSRSPSLIPTKAELAAQLSPNNHLTPKANSTQPVNTVIDLLSSDDEPSAALSSFKASAALKSPPKQTGSSFSNNRMMQQTAPSSEEGSSPDPEPRTSMLQPSAAKAMTDSSSAEQSDDAQRRPVAKTSILNPSATHASSTDAPIASSAAEELSDPEMQDDEWFIESILAHHLSDPKTHPTEFGKTPVMLYQVKWENHDKPTWEPIESFGDKSIVAEYSKRKGLPLSTTEAAITPDDNPTRFPKIATNLPTHPSPPKKPQQQPIGDESIDEDLEEDEYEIERIVGHHLSDPKTHPRELGRTPVMLYKVKWRDWEELTWEPASSFADESILREYRRRARLDARDPDGDEEMTTVK